MKRNKALTGLAFLLVFAFHTGDAQAQKQTDVALSVYGAFSNTATGAIVKETPSDSAGGMIELRHIIHPWIGFEATYAMNRANQVYELSCSYCTVPTVASSADERGVIGDSVFTSCPFCTSPTIVVSANAHAITGDWVFSSFHAAKFRPFAVVGIGVLYFQPIASFENALAAPTNSSNSPVFVYGAGVDWKILPHMGLRLQYRGNFYNAPVLTSAYKTFGSIGTTLTHTAEPAIGAYYIF